MRNLTMLTDLYQLTMMYGYHKRDLHHKTVVFDLFFRKTKGSGEYAIAAGLEQVIELINNLHFGDDDIAYLRSLGLFDESFLELLRNFKFTGEIYAVMEGTVVFPYEPLIRVKAPIMQAQLIETAMLNIVNHQTLIATKASRVVYAAEGSSVIEFGLRRAQGPDAGIYGARAAIIGGCVSTSNVLTGEMFGIAAKGTHGHSWVMSFENEIDAFRAYAEVFPNTCMLLVDTYDTLRSGVPNAIKVFEELRQKGHEPVGIRLDSGDLAYLSKKARAMLDAAGFPEAKIFASSDIDEWLIRDLKLQGARIDAWGVGTKLITSDGCPALGGVYKLSGEVVHGNVIPKIKVSDNVEKITNPGYKKLIRIYDNATGKTIADLIMLDDEVIDESRPLVIFHPVDTWKRMKLSNYHVKELLIPVFVDGKQVYQSPSLMQIQRHAKQSLGEFWDEIKRIVNPQEYKVDLSQRLFDLKKSMLELWSN